mmetsp:Transcript_3681/g.12923  ORF Transcript_3681/g.12923 Transcript_3681/m.12923 type:complete len:406 (+) Transcript_3681:605-1822(+)
MELGHSVPPEGRDVSSSQDGVVHATLLGNHLGRHRLSGSRWPIEQHVPEWGSPLLGHQQAARQAPDPLPKALVEHDVLHGVLLLGAGRRKHPPCPAEDVRPRRVPHQRGSPQVPLKRPGGNLCPLPGPVHSQRHERNSPSEHGHLGLIGQDVLGPLPQAREDGLGDLDGLVPLLLGLEQELPPEDVLVRPVLLGPALGLGQGLDPDLLLLHLDPVGLRGPPLLLNALLNCELLRLDPLLALFLQGDHFRVPLPLLLVRFLLPPAGQLVLEFGDLALVLRLLLGILPLLLPSHLLLLHGVLARGRLHFGLLRLVLLLLGDLLRLREVQDLLRVGRVVYLAQGLRTAFQGLRIKTDARVRRRGLAVALRHPQGRRRRQALHKPAAHGLHARRAPYLLYSDKTKKPSP